MKAMCPFSYYHSYFNVTHALAHMIYGYETTHHISKTNNYSKAIVMIIGKTRCDKDHSLDNQFWTETKADPCMCYICI